ncbi:MAG: hypothetical protein COA46_11930 [Porticoccaceae bacterium]|nr:MAG: hypothetical protein COA46_11930 [Porticoccaceae bacterium]
MSRKGETETTHFRSARVESLNGQWFFAVREGAKMVGPFCTQKEAQKSAASYAKDIDEGRDPMHVMSDQVMAKGFSLK